MTDDEINAVVQAAVAALDKQIVVLTRAVDRLFGSWVERHEEWRRWRDQNCGRELDPSDKDYPAILAAHPQTEWRTK
jgi:hypothetical protein